MHLSVGEKLQKTGDGGVALLSSSTVPATQSNLDALKQAGAASPDTTLADPNAAAEVANALQLAALPTEATVDTRPEIDPSKLPPAATPTQTVIDMVTRQDPAAADGGAPSPETVRQTKDRASSETNAILASEVVTGTETGQASRKSAQQQDQAASIQDQRAADAAHASVGPGETLLRRSRRPPPSTHPASQCLRG